MIARVKGLTAYSSTALNPKGIIARCYDSTYGERWFKYVQNGEASTAAVAGGAACQKLAAAVTAGQTVQVPTDTSDEMLGGIWMAAVTAQYYGWLQILGYHTAGIISTVAAVIVAYDSLKVTAAAAQSFTKDQVVGTVPSFPKYVRALEAYTTESVTAAIKVYICVGPW